MQFPDPLERYPHANWKGTAFLKGIVSHPRIEVGDYSYYDDSRGPEHFVARCVRYHFEHIGDRLIIGKFVAIAQGAQFLMNGANHPLGGFSTYPFEMLGFGVPSQLNLNGLLLKGDMVIGNDVWIGRESVIMPGVSIGDGAIIGARALVAKDVPPYAVMAGNPAVARRMRFSAAIIKRLLAIRWWDWPAEKIARNTAAISGADIAALEAAR